MDSPNSKADDVDRRASLRHSRAVSVGAQEEDDYEIQALGVADGFRPQMTGGNLPSMESSSTSAPTASSGMNPPSPPRLSTATRASIAKPPRGQHDSFSLRHDGATAPTQPPALPSRVSSTSTVSPFIHNETPYEGPSGPSHPYQMYPQNTRVARTLSVATSSTAPVSETSYAGPRGPSHPYGMYPQNTVPEQPPVPVAGSSIPVGFPGMPDNYQRRIGPEGEDVADIIGPDGHTEQLPPYTRYPDEAYAVKVRDLEQSAPAPATSLQPLPGAGGLGLATRNPEFESTDELGTPQSRYSTRSFTSEASQHEINVAAAEVSEKPSEKKWKQRAKKRAFGVVPCWALCLAVFSILLIGIILGGVIGALFGKAKRAQHPLVSSSPDTVPAVTVTYTYDAAAIPTPTDLPDLPQGTFGLPLGLNASPNVCFNDTTLSQAWSCNIIFGAQVSLTVTQSTPQPGKANSYDINLDCNESATVADGVYTYGAQPPVFSGTWHMELVNDTTNLSRGPAWFKMVPYNKTVVVPQSFLTTATSAAATPTSGSKARRYNVMPGGMGGGDFQRRGVAQVGDMPWVCVWPKTFIEVFIYPQQNSSYNAISSSTPTSTFWPSPPSSTTTPPPPPGVTASSVYPPPPTPVTPDPSWMSFLPPYPRVVKVEERRLDWSPAPTCTQIEILENGGAQPVVDSDGNPVELIIVESEPTSPTTAQYRARDIFARDGPDLSSCGCMWYST